MPALTYLHAEGTALVSLLSPGLPAEWQLCGESSQGLKVSACSQAEEFAAQVEAHSKESIHGFQNCKCIRLTEEEVEFQVWSEECLQEMGDASRGHLIQLGEHFCHCQHARAWHSWGGQIVRKPGTISVSQSPRLPWSATSVAIWTLLKSFSSFFCLFSSLPSQARIFTRLPIAYWLMFLHLTYVWKRGFLIIT